MENEVNKNPSLNIEKQLNEALKIKKEIKMLIQETNLNVLLVDFLKRFVKVLKEFKTIILNNQ